MLFLTLPIYLMQVYTRVLSSRSEDTLLYLTIAALGAFAIFGFLSAVRGRLLLRISQKIDALLGEQVLTALMTRAADPKGDDSAQGLRDLALVRNFLGGNDMTVLMDAPWTPLFLAVIFIIHPMLGLVGAAGAVVLLLLAIANELATRKPLRSANSMAISTQGNVESSLRNAEVIQAMGMGGSILQRWSARNREVVDAQGRAGDRASNIQSFSRSIRMGVQIMMLAAGAFLVMKNELTMGMVIVPMLLLARALQPTEMAIGTWRSLVNARAAYGRLEKLLKDGPSANTAMRLPTPKGALTVERLVFTLSTIDKAILRGVSFVVEPGEMVGVVGPTASGKSTLARLLVGVWKPFAGSVRLDGADVSTWDHEDLGRHVGYLPQDVELFQGTVRDNISRLRDAEPEEIVEAARAAGVHDLILKLPDGYDTRIGRGGYVLSGGQQQRVALARALFGRPRLLVLDEPNSNLDSDGEEALIGALAEAKQAGTTCIIVAHRPAVLRHADKILQLRNGRVELFGDRDEVMAKLSPRGRQPRVVSIADDRRGNSPSKEAAP
jgi:PrtD family type I secretion system ABC transporter